ncbi:MAG: zinc ribbon domain-containing protein [Candidatus Thermoplasmatota archaeon]
MPPLAAKETQEVAECPSCGAEVALEAKECPNCGEIFSEDLLTAASEPEGRPSRLEKLLFYGGLVLVLAGGPGIALGSWLHDVLRIPIIGDAYETFGPLNQVFAAGGLIVLLVGIVLLILSIRFAKPTFDYDVGTPKKA